MSLDLFLFAWQAAWAANDYSVQDTLDHEVYKMIGRHGSSMVSRGIVAAGSLHATGVAGKCALAPYQNAYQDILTYSTREPFSAINSMAPTSVQAVRRSKKWPATTCMDQKLCRTKRTGRIATAPWSRPISTTRFSPRTFYDEVLFPQ